MPARVRLPALVAFLREAHPNPHRFVSKAELDARLEAEMQAFDGAPDPIALAQGAFRVLATVGDAHLAVGLGPETTAGPLVPFLVKSVGPRVFLEASEPPMPIGTELVAVEGRPVRELLDEIAALASVDGARAAVRMAEAERRFSFLALMELGAQANIELLVRRPGADPETITLEATDREGLGAFPRPREELRIQRHTLPASTSQQRFPKATRIVVRAVSQEMGMTAFCARFSSSVSHSASSRQASSSVEQRRHGHDHVAQTIRCLRSHR